MTARALIYLIAAGFVTVGLLSGCRSSDRRKIEARLWLIDSEDSTIYRVINKPDGTQAEQYYSIPDNPDKMKEFACMLADDRKKLYDAWVRCGCYL